MKNSIIIVTIFFILISVFFAVSAEIRKSDIEQTNSMIKWLCIKRYKAEQNRLGVNWGKHRLLKNRKMLNEISIAVVYSSITYDIPKSIILSTAWFESKLNRRVIIGERLGDKGEYGLMQNHGLSAQNCNLNTIQGQINCGSNWLKLAYEKCGNSWIKAFVAYRSGKCTAPEKSALLHSANLRFNLSKILANRGDWSKDDDS
jgi:hypothetical protein